MWCVCVFVQLVYVCVWQAFAQDGLRTLCCAMKKIDTLVFEEWRQKYHVARSDFGTELMNIR